MYFPPKHGWLARLANHQDALHHQLPVLRAARRGRRLPPRPAARLRPPRTAAACSSRIVVAAVGAETWYLVAANTGTDAPMRAAAVLQPAMLVWSIAAVAGLFLLGSATPSAGSPAAAPTARLALALRPFVRRVPGAPAVLWLLLQGQVRVAARAARPSLLTVVAYVARRRRLARRHRGLPALAAQPPAHRPARPAFDHEPAAMPR